MSHEIDIPCPNCKAKIKETLLNFKPGYSRKCPKCNTVIKFTGESLNNLQEDLAKFDKLFKISK
jgi:hypothetical protein